MINLENKTRLKTDEELALQNKGLIEIKQILEKAKVPYFLASGTLLGAVREKNFISWDWDVQCYFKAEDVVNRMEELKNLFSNADFNIEKVNKSFESLKFSLTKYNTLFELTAWYLDGEMRRRITSQLPARFFENPVAIEFLGHTYPCMTPAEDYLEFCYGDWKTPLRSDDKEAYIADQFYSEPRLKRLIKKYYHQTQKQIRKTLKKLLQFLRIIK